MTVDTSRTTSYTDLGGLNQLKQLGRKDDAAALHKVAQQFESMFVSQLLKNMREGTKIFNEDDPMNSSEVEFHQEMYDQQLSLNLSSGKGIGLADVLERQLGKQYHIKKPEDKISAANQLLNRPFAINRSEHGSGTKLNATPKLKPLEISPKDKKFPIKISSPAAKPVEKKSMFDSPQQFIKSLYQHASEAAKALGVKTEVLLSQAALETGWGKHVMQDKSGNSSHNLFGIKAAGGNADIDKSSAGWKGDVVNVSSLESEDGVMKPVVSTFRSYDSFKDSFDDYVAFLKSNPRYQQALSVAHDTTKFVNALQESGYATDPDYAKKLLDIISSNKISSDVFKK